MGQEMTSFVKCSQCLRSFPVRAQMQFEGKALPMLVVLSQVDIVEAALEQATCQVCLGKTGSADRGLYKVLKMLGLKDEDEVPPPREAVVIVHVREDHAAPTMGVAISDARLREVAMVDPLMGTSIEVQTQHARDRRPRGPRRDDSRSAQSEPRVPRALRVPECREPPPEVEHLTGAIGDLGDNSAVLGVAMKAAKERDEARRLERAEKFEKLTHWLKLMLAKIRKRAQAQEVWNLVETFERKLSEAEKLDAQQRSKKGLLATLGTSKEGLEELCLRFRQSWERVRVRNPDIITVDAFEGGRRPEFWDLKGGKKPAFYQFVVIRTKSSLPVSNPSFLVGDEYPRHRIFYPQGGEYGSDCEVEHSRRDPKIDQICAGLSTEFVRWLGQCREKLGITTTLAKLQDDIVDLVEAFFVFEKLKRQDAPAAIEPTDENVEPIINTSELPAST